MTTLSPDALIDAFIADGNTLIGHRPAVINRSFSLTWAGAGCVLEMGENVTLTMAVIVFQPGGGHISIGRNALIKGRLEVASRGSIKIGEDTCLNRPCDFRGGEGAAIVIGDRCLFSNVKVMTSDMHSVLNLATGRRTNPAAGIAIEDEVWLAEDVKVAKGVRIGTGSVIAAGSLITRSIAPYSLAAGRPARVLRSGVTWTRALQRMRPLPPPAFQPEDIPRERSVLQLLVSRKQFALVEAVIAAADPNTRTTFERWYLVYCRHQLGKENPGALEVLQQVLTDNPGHKTARKLYETLSKAAE
jgi:acetyltransferase-like isoleucine patch superfamily enzyme